MTSGQKLPVSCLIEGCKISIDDESKLSSSQIQWETILPQSKLSADHEHNFESVIEDSFTHVRLSIFPDGGVSRMRLWGRIKK